MYRLLSTLPIAFLALFTLGTMTACATLYQQSPTTYEGLTLSHNLPEEDMRAITKTVLHEAGYEVREEDGRFVTDARRMSLTQKEADCGKTMGVYHVDNDATVIYVTMDARFEPDAVIFRSDIRGAFRKDDPLEGQSFKCESTGAMERELSAAVRAKVEGE